MKYKKIIFWTIIYCGLFLLLQYTVYRYHFYYIEQLQLFLSTRQYASDTILQPGGLSRYLAGFIVQFFMFPTSGALITSLLLTSVGILTQCLSEKIAHSRITFLVSLIPTGLLFILHTDMNYNIQGTIACLIMLTALNIYAGINTFIKRIVTGMIMVPVLFFVAGAVVSLFAIIVAFWEFIRKNPGRYYSLILFVEVALIGVASIYLNLHGELRMILLPDAYYEFLLKNKIIYYTWYAFPLALITTRIFGKSKFRISARAATLSSGKETAITTLPALAFFIFLIWTSVNDKRLILKSVEQDYYLRNCRWDKIIETFPSEGYNLQIMNVMNLALSQKNLLGDRLFDYNKQGHQNILAEWDDTHVNAIALSDIYYYIGDVAVAQKLAFEGMVISLNNGNVRLLQRLIETNLISGEYPVAEKYIRLLEQTLFYKKKAQQYRTFLYNDEAVENDYALGNKRKAFVFVKDNMYAGSINMFETFDRLTEHQPGNTLPLQYMLAICLTNKDLKTFRALHEKYFRTDMRPSLSISHQEALIALEQGNPGFWIKNGVSTQVEKRFRAFDMDMHNRNHPDFKEKMRLAHGNTYWYYLLFNDIKTNKLNENNKLYRDDTRPHAPNMGGGGGGVNPQIRWTLR
ncbi:MAG: DMT family transporter, partial [Tannerella sp.]|nr:DMT family transporter [Tannerella sp.]